MGRLTDDRIQTFLSRAGVADVRPSPTGVLETESVLVLEGGMAKSLAIYDQTGAKIGEAVRFQDRYSEVGYGYHYELSGAQLWCVLRDVTRRRFGVGSWPYARSVIGPNGAEIATITQSGPGNDRCAIASGGTQVASVRRVWWRDGMRPSSAAPITLIARGKRPLDRVRSRVWSTEDEPGHSLARITYLPDTTSLVGREVAYIVELEARLDERLRMTAVSFCLVADNRMKLSEIT